MPFNTICIDLIDADTVAPFLTCEQTYVECIHHTSPEAIAAQCVRNYHIMRDMLAQNIAWGINAFFNPDPTGDNLSYRECGEEIVIVTKDFVVYAKATA